MNTSKIVLIAGVTLAALASPAQAQKPGDKIAGSYICVFDATVTRGGMLLLLPNVQHKAAKRS